MTSSLSQTSRSLVPVRSLLVGLVLGQICGERDLSKEEEEEKGAARASLLYVLSKAAHSGPSACDSELCDFVTGVFVVT